jgi:hypothetical protein
MSDTADNTAAAITTTKPSRKPRRRASGASAASAAATSDHGGDGNGSGRTHKTRCGICDACQRQDCGTCVWCLKKKKFGGKGDSKQACLYRRCTAIDRNRSGRERRRKESRKERGGTSSSTSRRRNTKRSRTTAAAAATSETGSAGSDVIWGGEYNEEDYEEDTITSEGPGGRPSKRRRSGTGGSRSSDVEEPKDPLVLQLEQAFPGPPPSLLATVTTEEDEMIAFNGGGLAKKNPTMASTSTLASTTRTSLSDYKYGLPVPPPIIDVCAGCRRAQAPPSDSGQEPVILLCDGPDCNCEYHLECCIPPITEVPSGNYYCVDCNPHGSSAVLVQYLEDHDERRAQEIEVARSNSSSSSDASTMTTNPPHHRFAFLHALWREDLEENQENWADEKEDGTPTENRVPRSELGRLLDLQHQLVGFSTSGGASSSSAKHQQHQHHHPAMSFDDLCHLLLGKPIRLYCPLDDNYHSGRIVDYRPLPQNLHTFPSPRSTSSSSGKKSKQSSPTSASASGSSASSFPGNKSFLPTDDFFANQVEFLVRFVPGSDEHRKTLVHRWIRLEEHSLAVGTHLAWGKFNAGSITTMTTTASSTGGGGKKGSPSPSASSAAVTAPSPGHHQHHHHGTAPAACWQPALLFLRTSRELMPVLHLLQEEEGEISYHPASLLQRGGGSGSSSKSKKDKGPSSSASGMPKKDPAKVWALAKRLGSNTSSATSDPYGSPTDSTTPFSNNNGGGSEAYKLLRIADEARDLFARKPGSGHVDQLKLSLALAEHNEQQAVVQWRNMPLKNKWGKHALTSRDELALGSVAFQNYDSIASGFGPNYHKEERELCPLIRPPGLDRSYLMDQLVHRGLVNKEAVKDAAAEVQCWLLP